MIKGRRRHPTGQARCPKIKGKLRNKATAFDWPAYRTRCASLRLLRRDKVRVDTLIKTHDGYSERVHWQVFSTLCPRLIEQSRIISQRSKGLVCNVELPRQIKAAMALLLVECAYGEQKISLERENLNEFYQICQEFEIQCGLKACLNFAKSVLDVDNCIYLLRLATKHRHNRLRRAAYSVLRSNFKLVLSVNRDFHLLDFNCLKNLLMDDFLQLGDEEELAWLAILRWISKKPMTQAKLASLYNEMVARADDIQINLFQARTLQPGPLENRRQTLSGGLRQTSLRVMFDFYSPGTSIQGYRRKQAENEKTQLALSPLRSIAEESMLDSGNTKAGVDEKELLTLIKCLRFMRFKSPYAFDVISGHPLVSRSETLRSLLSHMRIRYKLRRKLALTESEKQTISREDLAELEYQESGRAKRALKRLAQLVGGLHEAGNPTNLAQDLARSSRVRGAFNSPLDKDSTQIGNEAGRTEALNDANEPRVPRSIGLLFGGWQDGAISKTIWSYDFIYDRWFKLNIKLPEARALHASCTSPRTNHVYIFGGTDGEQILKSVWRFNPTSDVRLIAAKKGVPACRLSWRSKVITRTIKSGGGHGRQQTSVSYRFKQLCPMNEQRCHLSGVFHSDGRLYALGGHNGSQRLRSCEWYDPKCNQWHPIAPMIIARSDAAACSHENRIFIAGGQFGDQFIQSSVEFYKSSDNTWTFVAPMMIPRMSFCLASYKGHLIALGGTNGLLNGDEVASVTRSVERYNQQTGSWSFCVPMIQKRCSFGSMVIGDKLIIVGGHGGNRRLRLCETLRVGQFDAITNQESGQDRASPPSDPLPTNRTSMLRSVSANANLGQQAQQGQSLRPNSALNQPDGSELEPNGPPRPLRNPGPNQRQAARQINLRFPNSDARVEQINPQNAMKWERKSNMPERRSGFSIAVVNELRNAKAYTYIGSRHKLKRPVTSAERSPKRVPACLVRRASRWKRFKVIKRRKLIKHLKIALVVSIVILML